MADTILATEVAAHYDGERLVIDEPLSLPTGVKLRIRISKEWKDEDPEARRARALAALDELAALSKVDEKSLDPKHYDDRDTYYDDLGRAGLV